jgi:hypothetical protein
MPLTCGAAPWLWIAMGGEMPEADEPVPEPVLGDMGRVKVLLLPAPPAGAYCAALFEPGAPPLAPAAAAAEACALELELDPEPKPGEPAPAPTLAPAPATAAAEAPAFEPEPSPDPACAPAAAPAEAVAYAYAPGPDAMGAMIVATSELSPQTVQVTTAFVKPDGT